MEDDNNDDYEESSTHSNDSDLQLTIFYNNVTTSKLISSSLSPILYIFERDNNYNIYDKNAELIALQFNLKNLRFNEHLKMNYISISQNKIESVLRSYKAEYSINLYKYDEFWYLAKSILPNDDIGFSELFISNNCIQIAIKKSTAGLGVALLDIDKKWVGCIVLDINDYIKLLTDLISTYVIINVYICNTEWNAEEINTLNELFNNKIKVLKKAEFTCNDIENRMIAMFGNVTHIDSIANALAISALGCLCLVNDLPQSNCSNFLFENIRMASRMRLDKIALRALNVFPTSTDRNKQSSLYGILNQCKTSMGSRLLTAWLTHPLINFDEIQRRLNFVEIFVNDTEMRQTLNEQQFKLIPDIDRIKTKLQKRTATIQDCVTLYNFVNQLPYILETFRSTGQNHELINTDVIAPLTNFVVQFRPFIEMVEQTIDLPAVERHEYMINSNFSPELGQIAIQKNKIRKEIDQFLEKSKRDFGVEVKLNHSATAGYHFRVSRKDEKGIRDAKVIILETRKDGVKFTTYGLKPVSSKYTELCDQYDAIQKDIVKKLIDIVASYIPLLEESSKFIAEFDVLVAFAIVSVNAPISYCRPNILPIGSGVLTMKEARHPCLELQSVACIPNDVNLNKGENIQVITGPNMGGKSTYIRSIGTIVLLAQIGCFVPCAEASISIVDAIMARVGAGDCQLRGISTFMAEMVEASAILKAATRDSLLIIDELGRGTSTYEGYGLAYAITEFISNEVGAFALFATHFHELTRLASSVPSVVNKHVTASTSDNSIAMLYKVLPGPCDRSFGIHVAEMVKFPTAVIDIAKRKISELESYGKSDDGSETKKAKVDKSSFMSEFRKLQTSSPNELLAATKELAATYGFL